VTIMSLPVLIRPVPARVATRPEGVIRPDRSLTGRIRPDMWVANVPTRVNSPHSYNCDIGCPVDNAPLAGHLCVCRSS
jgi:hypothetical protein